MKTISRLVIYSEPDLSLCDMGEKLRRLAKAAS